MSTRSIAFSAPSSFQDVSQLDEEPFPYGDPMLGTAANDVIFATNGNDLIFGDPFTEGNFHGFPGNGAILAAGRGGNDVIYGRDSVDYIIGDAATLTGSARGGDDLLIGGDGGDSDAFQVLGGDSDNVMSGSARGGDDGLIGGNGIDYIVGDAFQMLDNTRAGNDFLFGDGGDDFLYGDADGSMESNARGGDDVLLGGSGKDDLRGDNGWIGMTGHARGGNDSLFGGDDDDLLIGDAASMSEQTVCGDDLIVGGRGNDILYGDADPLVSDLAEVTRGRDRFVFAARSGQDSLLDFEDERDVIDLVGYLRVAGFAQVLARAEQEGDDVVIDLGAAAGGTAGVDTLRLANFALASLDAGDFAFG